MEYPKRYDIKDAARYLGVAPSALRYWEREGLVSAERNGANDYRRYSVHDLIDAGEIVFYRKLGVPVKELRGYRSLSLETLDEALADTQSDIERRIAELEAVGARLARQRSLNACAKRLARGGMRPGTPAIKRLSPLDYDSQRQWQLFVDEPWRYGIIVEAAQPDVYREAVVDLPASEGETIWPESAEANRREKGGRATRSLECLLRIDPETDETNAPALFAEAVRYGLHARLIIGSYLLAAADDGAGDPRWDYYRAWVIA